MYNTAVRYDVPEVGEVTIKTVILDLNGTLSINGTISDRTKELLKELTKREVEIVLLTGDQRGTAKALCSELDISFVRCKNSAEKSEASKRFDKNTTAAIGNARIDIGTFENAIVSIATLQAEGIHAEIIPYVDIIVPTIENALEILLDPNSFAATMRK